MSRRTTAAALLLTLLVLVPTHATGKGPTEVEVHDLRTGETTSPSLEETIALRDLVGWPERHTEPRRVRGGSLAPIARLTWHNGDNVAAWSDTIYANGPGHAWVERRDHTSGSTSVTWGRVKHGIALHVVLAASVDPAGDATPTLWPTRAAASPDAPAAKPSRDRAPKAATARFDAASFGWGAALAGLLAASVFLVARRRRSLSGR